MIEFGCSVSGTTGSGSPSGSSAAPSSRMTDYDAQKRRSQGRRPAGIASGCTLATIRDARPHPPASRTTTTHVASGTTIRKMKNRIRRTRSSTLGAGFAVASVLVAGSAAAVAADDAQRRRRGQQQQQQVCSCSPRSYAFRLLLDGDCSSSSLSPNNSDNSDDGNGISSKTCQITAVARSGSGGNRRLLEQRRAPQQRRVRRAIVSEEDGEEEEEEVGVVSSGYIPVWRDGGHCIEDRRSGTMERYDTMEECCEKAFSWMTTDYCLFKSMQLEYIDAESRDDSESELSPSNARSWLTIDDPYLSRIESQLVSPQSSMVVRSTRQSGVADAAPAFVSSMLFFEFDASGELTVIHQDEKYVNITEGLADGAVVEYDSVSQKLNASLPLEEQQQYVPGGAGLFVFGNDEEGGLMLRGRFAWEFTGNCDVVPALAGETLGWIGFEDTSPAKHEFCPASPSYPPTAEPTTAPKSTDAPSVAATPSTPIPSYPPSLGDTAAPTPLRPSEKPVTTASPTDEPSASPEKATTAEPTAGATVPATPTTFGKATKSSKTGKSSKALFAKSSKGSGASTLESGDGSSDAVFAKNGKAASPEKEEEKHEFEASDAKAIKHQSAAKGSKSTKAYVSKGSKSTFSKGGKGSSKTGATLPEESEVANFPKAAKVFPKATKAEVTVKSGQVEDEFRIFHSRGPKSP